MNTSASSELAERAALTEKLTHAWADPDRLSELILEAVNSGRAEFVAGAAEHLFKIDPLADRRYFVLSRVVARQGHFTKALQLLDRYEQLYGISAQLEIERSLLARERHLASRAEEHLWRAVTLAPNEADVLDTYLLAARNDTSTSAPSRELAALERAAALPECYLAKLWLARTLLEQGEKRRADTLLNEAMLGSSSDASILRAAIAAVAGARGLDAAWTAATLHHADRDPTVAVALLHAARIAGRREHVDELLSTVASDERLARVVRYYESWMRPEERDRESVAPSELTLAITTLARTEMPRYRQQCYRAILDSNLFLALEPPLPRFARDLTVDADSLQPRPLRRTSSAGKSVALAFSDRGARAKWRHDATCVEFGAAELFALIAEEPELELEINPAGPASMPITSDEIAMLAAGKLPELTAEELEERRSYFLIEPFTEAPSPRALDTLRRIASSYLEIAEAYLLQTVEESHGTALAVTVLFRAGVPAADEREVLADLADPVRHPDVSRHVRFLDAREPKTLLPLSRESGIALIAQ